MKEEDLSQFVAQICNEHTHTSPHTYTCTHTYPNTYVRIIIHVCMHTQQCKPSTHSHSGTHSKFSYLGDFFSFSESVDLSCESSFCCFLCLAFFFFPLDTLSSLHPCMCVCINRETNSSRLCIHNRDCKGAGISSCN